MSGQATEAGREVVRDLLEKILREMVDTPEALSVSIFVGEKTTVFRVTCAPDNLGQIIGSKGKNIDGVRTIVKAICARHDFRGIVEIPG